mgnify:CR=1 FL=1
MKRNFFLYIHVSAFCVLSQLCYSVSPSDALAQVNDWYNANPYSDRTATMTGESNGTYLSSKLSILRSHSNWLIRSVYSDPYEFELLHYWGRDSEVRVHFPLQRTTCADEDPLTGAIFRETSLLHSRSVDELQDLGYVLRADDFEDYVKLSLVKHDSAQVRLVFYIDSSGKIFRIDSMLGGDEFNYVFKDEESDLGDLKDDASFAVGELKKRIDEKIKEVRGLYVSDDISYAKLLENEIVLSFQEKVLGIN